MYHAVSISNAVNIMKKLFLALVCLNLLNPPVFAAAAGPANPFAEPSTLPLQAPPFDKIKDSDYTQAFEEGMKQHLAEIQAIAGNKDAPTFDNTIAAMEKSGRMLERVSATFGAVVQANTNDTLDKIQADMAPRLAAHHDEIALNPQLFARVKALYKQRGNLHLDQEAGLVLETYYQDFVHAGANLNDADKTKLRDLNRQAAQLETAFQQKLIAASKAGELEIKDKNDLDGLSDNDIAALAVKENGQEKYIIPLQNTTQQPLLSSLRNRDVRERLFEHSWRRAERNDANDTRAIIAKLARIRAQQAALLGYPNYAEYTLYDKMAVTSKAVKNFLGQLVPATRTKAALEAQDIQKLIDTTGHFQLKPWDWNLYAEQIRKMRYKLNENQLKPYLELNNVLENGVFYSANLLYGISFRERHDIPVYQPDVRVFDVFDKDGSQLGLLYVDIFKRDNKSGGAWTDNFVQQSRLLGSRPVVFVVTNFTKPAQGQPAVLTFTDVTTLFHEFGHALNGLFGNVTYPASNNIARDFVELPSQFNEHWASYPAVLKHYAVHYQTHEPIKQDMVEKLKKSATFNQGYALGELLAAAELDMQWHSLSASAPEQDVDAFETRALRKTHTDFPNVPTRYRSSYFLHIWSNGYPAGYYAYLWTEMLDDDAYAWFMQHGGLTRANGQRFRDLILSRGHTEDYNRMFEAFYGRKPDIQPMLEHRGIAKS